MQRRIKLNRGEEKRDMGDHRMSIKIDASFHGVKDSCDMWINYFPGQCAGVDDRVIEFFQSLFERGMDKYEETAAQEIMKNASQTHNNASPKFPCEWCDISPTHDWNKWKYAYCPYCGRQLRAVA